MREQDTRTDNWLLVGGLMVLLVCAACMLLILYGIFMQPWLNTEYAATYSGNAFRAVAIGDSEQRVLDLLGEPLERTTSSHDPTYVYFHYSRAHGKSDSYLSRIIQLKDGRVLRIVREVYLD